jgi:hypothetical protein
MSTAIERIMRERGDLNCAHEPFMYDYYVNRSNAMPHFDVDPDHPQTYADIRDMLIERAQAGPVFFKDMSYYVVPHILDDDLFRPHLKNVFLVRRPKAAIVSYHKLDPKVSSDEIGIAPPDPDAEEKEDRKFEAACAEAPHLRDYLAEHLPAYEQLSGLALKSD